MNLTEIAVGVVVTAILVLAVASGTGLITKSAFKFKKEGAVNDELTEAFANLFKVGTHAQSCTVERSGTEPLPQEPGTVLVCQVDTAGDGKLTAFRFAHDPTKKVLNFYYGSETKPKHSYLHIGEFRICDDRAMGYQNGSDPEVADRCLMDACNEWGLKNVGGKALKYCKDGKKRLSLKHIDNLQGNFADKSTDPNETAPSDLKSRQNRFFRFKIVGLAPATGTHTLQHSIALQGAFHVRNPTPKSLGFAAYLWN